MDEPGARTTISASQGAHIVLPKTFLPGDSAIMVPRTKDGRVLFAVPWHGHVVVGTTDTPVDKLVLEPRPLKQELDFLFTHAAKYLDKDPRPSDVLSAFAGLRPLVKTTGKGSTAALSRDHHISVSQSGLVTIAGGKWTTFRKMGEDTVDHAEVVAGVQHRPCRTPQLHLHGWTADDQPDGSPLQVYGSDAQAIEALATANPALRQRLCPDLPYIAAEAVWSVRYEMARTVEDVLARRTRALLLGAKASMESASKVAALMAAELGRDKAWQKKAVEDYLAVARRYVLR
jgi:glycerol-3-phosphate dehydrogenase